MNSKLHEVGQRLENAASELLSENSSASERYDTIEMLAIQILDSEFESFGPGELEEYLRCYLAALPQK